MGTKRKKYYASRSDIVMTGEMDNNMSRALDDPFSSARNAKMM
jgi:hypothetical protein